MHAGLFTYLEFWTGPQNYSLQSIHKHWLTRKTSWNLDKMTWWLFYHIILYKCLDPFISLCSPPICYAYSTFRFLVFSSSVVHLVCLMKSNVHCNWIMFSKNRLVSVALDCYVTPLLSPSFAASALSPSKHFANAIVCSSLRLSLINPMPPFVFVDTLAFQRLPERRRGKRKNPATTSHRGGRFRPL